MDMKHINFIKGLTIAIFITIFINFISGTIYEFMLNLYFYVTKKSSNYIETSAEYEIFNALSAYSSLVVLYLMSRKKLKDIIKILKFKKINRKTIINTIFTSISISMIIGIITTIMMLVFFTNVTEGANDLIDQDIQNSVICAIGTAIIIPIYEEIIFRGVILNVLIKNMNKFYAILIQAILFGAYHQDIEQFIDAGIYGIFLGILVLYTKSIYSSVLAHIVINSISVVFVYTNSVALLVFISEIIGFIILIKNRKHIIRKIKLSLE